MAKQGTLDHPKNKRLARALGTIPGVTLGLLETLWTFATQFKPDGGLTLVDIEDALDAGNWLTMFSVEQVVAAMTDRARQCAWLDHLEDGRFYIHDWHDHATDSLNRSLARAVMLFANGMRPKLVKLDAAERDRLTAAYQAKYGHPEPSKTQAQAPKTSTKGDSGTSGHPKAPTGTHGGPTLPNQTLPSHNQTERDARGEPDEITLCESPPWWDDPSSQSSEECKEIARIMSSATLADGRTAFGPDQIPEHSCQTLTVRLRSASPDWDSTVVLLKKFAGQMAKHDRMPTSDPLSWFLASWVPRISSHKAASKPKTHESAFTQALAELGSEP